jgi:hypothetical protein
MKLDELPKIRDEIRLGPGRQDYSGFDILEYFLQRR